MNGFAGIVRTDGAPLDGAVIDALAAAAPYRRTGAPITWRDATAGFVQFAAPTGQGAGADAGPVTHPQSGLVACVEGRFDHRAAILARVPAGSRPTDGSSDAALSLALVAAFGDRFLRMLAGDYAVALWNPHTRRLLCARSPGGWRPFYWTQTAQFFAFASEPLTLVRGLDLSRHLNEGAIAEFVAARFTTPTETFLRDLRVLPPGSALEVVDGRTRVWRWHEPPPTDGHPLTDSEHVGRFTRLFDDAIVEATRGDEIVAAQLSGGLDSSSVVARSIALSRAGRIREPRVISVRYPGEAFDESRWSRAVEAHLGIDAVGIAGHGAYDWDAAQAWSARTLHLPLRPNVVQQTIESPEWRALGASVILTGEGGDDWLSGSLSYLAELARHRETGRLLTLLARPHIAAPWPKRVGRLWRYGLRPLLSRAGRERLHHPQYRTSHLVPALLNRDWASRVDLVDRWRAASAARAASDAPARASVYTLARRQVNWANAIAFAGDHGVAIRHPLHDLPLTHDLLRAPGELFWRDGVKKWLLREAMRGELPEIVRTRPDKTSFSALTADALVARIAPNAVRRMAVVERGWIDPVALAAQLEQYHAWHRAGRPATLDATWLGATWAIVATDLWLQSVDSGGSRR